MADTGKPVPKAGLAPVPGVNSTDNIYERDVTGNKTDTALYAPSDTASVIRYLKALLGSQVISSGTFTSESATQPVDTSQIGQDANIFNGCSLMPVAGTYAFRPMKIASFVSSSGTFFMNPFNSWPVTPGLVPYVILADSNIPGIVTFGTFTTSSATVPADTGKGAIATDYFNGCLLIPLSGSVAFQARRIVKFTTTTGVFTLSPAAPFTTVSGTGPYMIIWDQEPSFNTILSGTFTTSSMTIPADTGKSAYGNDYFKGCVIMPLSGSAAFQPRIIKQFATATGVYTLDEPFTVAPGKVPYVLLPQNHPIQRLLDTFDIVNSILELKETGHSQLTTDGTEQICYINNSPQGVFIPRNFIIDTTAMQAGDTLVVKEYYIVKLGGSYILKSTTTYSDVQAVPLKVFELVPNRFGVKTTIQRTAGTDRAYDWEVFYENA